MEKRRKKGKWFFLLLGLSLLLAAGEIKSVEAATVTRREPAFEDSEDLSEYEFGDEPEESDPPFLSADVLSLTAEADGSLPDPYVDVTVSGMEGFTVSTPDSWIHMKEFDGDSEEEELFFDDSASFLVIVEKNASSSSRSGSIGITGSNGQQIWIAVKQKAGKVALEVSASEVMASVKGKLSDASIEVNTKGTGGFTAKSDRPWLKISSQPNGEEAEELTSEHGGKIYLSVKASNTSTARTGTITIRHESGEIEKKITVVQDARKPKLSVSIHEKEADKKGKFQNDAVSVDTGNTGAYTVEVKDASWLKISASSTRDIGDGLSKMNFTKDGAFYLVAEENRGGARTAKVTVTHSAGSPSETISVTQLGTEGAYLNIDRETAYFDEPKAGTSGVIHINADSDTKWVVTTDRSWIKVAKSADASAKDQHASLEGKGKSKFYILVEENGVYAKRAGKVYVKASGGKEAYEIYVSQAKNKRGLPSLLEEASVRVTKETFNVGKTTQVKITLPDGLYESDIESITYSSNKKKVATVNKKGSVKAIKKGTAVITVKVTLDSGVSKTFKLDIKVGKRKVTISEQK